MPESERLGQLGAWNATTMASAYVLPVVHTDFNDPWKDGEHWALVGENPYWTFLPVEVGDRVRLDDHEGTYCYGRITRWAAWGGARKYAYVEMEPDTWGHYEPEPDDA